MICVTGVEATAETLARRLSAHRGMMQEVRLDALGRVDDDVFELLQAHGRLVVTCRGIGEGGGFRGTPAEQREILLRAVSSGARWIDLEASAPQSVLRQLYQQRGDAGLILSLHCFQAGPWPEGRMQALSRLPGDVLKVAVPVDDAVDLTALRRVLASDPRPVVRIGLGPAGLLSRALWRRFGSPWSYFHVSQGSAVAPGQLSLDTARAWGLERQDSLRPLALVGGPHILSTSPGPDVYNALFAQRHTEHCYLPVVSGSPEVLALLASFGITGASITMPLKEVLLPGVVRLTGLARASAAINTVLAGDDGWHGDNTDHIAVASVLRSCPGKRVLVLGAGGAARAACGAARSVRGRVTLANRSDERARDVAAAQSISWVPWRHRGDVPFDVLVNATPLGADGTADPMPADVALTGRRVVDMVLRAGALETPLVRRAREAGARVFDGREVWLRQGVAQMQLLAGMDVGLSELRAFFPGPGAARAVAPPSGVRVGP